MKTTKRIKTLTTAIIAKDCYTNYDYIETELINLKRALLNGKYYTWVETVSKSGMSRVIKIAYIKNNRLTTITHPGILNLAGCNKNGKISGCGMDMLFAAQYDLFRALCPNHRYQSKMSRYNSI